MSAVPLSVAVGYAASLHDYEPESAFDAMIQRAMQRANTVGAESYPPAGPGEKEPWQLRSLDQTVIDLEEELADAVAYVAALTIRTANPAWSDVLFPLAQAWAQMEQMDLLTKAQEETTA